MTKFIGFQRKKGLIRRIRNMGYDLLGHGHCLGCEDTWPMTEMGSIFYAPGYNITPLCRECFNRLGVAEILMYCLELVLLWQKEGDSTRWEDIATAVGSAVLSMKRDGRYLK